MRTAHAFNQNDWNGFVWRLRCMKPAFCGPAAARQTTRLARQSNLNIQNAKSNQHQSGKYKCHPFYMPENDRCRKFRKSWNELRRRTKNYLRTTNWQLAICGRLWHPRSCHNLSGIQNAFHSNLMHFRRSRNSFVAKSRNRITRTEFRHLKTKIVEHMFYGLHIVFLLEFKMCGCEVIAFLRTQDFPKIPSLALVGSKKIKFYSPWNFRSLPHCEFVLLLSLLAANEFLCPFNGFTSDANFIGTPLWLALSISANVMGAHHTFAWWTDVDVTIKLNLCSDRLQTWCDLLFK